MKNTIKRFGGIVIIPIFIFSLLFGSCKGKSFGQPKADPETDFEAVPIDGGKGVKITEYIGDKWEVVIPYKIRGIPVTVIGETTREDRQDLGGAFYNKNITRVTIPDSVIKIGSAAFGKNQLLSITIGANVELDESFEQREYNALSQTYRWFNNGFERTYNSGGKLAGTYTRPDIDSTTWTKKSGIASSQNTSAVKSLFPPKADPETDFETQTIDGGKGIEIRYIGDKREVVIPAKIRGTPVTTIRDGAFLRRKLTRVTIPNSVTKIGKLAFSDNQLTSITIGKNVTTIGSSAFYGNQLKSVTIPNSVTEIEPVAFARNQLTSIIIGKNVITIGKGAFSGNQLTSVTIPNSVTEIGEYAFTYNQLTSITIGANVIIQNNAFNASEKFGKDGVINEDDNGFVGAYNNGGKRAGTYTRPNTNSTTWTRK